MSGVSKFGFLAPTHEDWVACEVMRLKYWPGVVMFIIIKTTQ